MTNTSTSSAPPGVIPPDRVRVLLPLPLPEAYDYSVPDGVNARPGDYVRVPLGRRAAIGIVWDPGKEPREAAVDAGRLKPIEAVLDILPMTAETRRLVDWVAAYTLTPPGAVLRMAMGPSAVLEDEGERLAYVPARAVSPRGRLTKTRERVLGVLDDGVPLSTTNLAPGGRLQPSRRARHGARGDLSRPSIFPAARRAPCRIGGCHTRRSRPRNRMPPRSSSRRCARGVSRLSSSTGVTGSGKTEVYFRAIAAVLEAGRQVLILLPEIALGAQWHARFERQFGCRAAAWHSDVKSSEREHVWRDVAEGKAKVVVGARSALFLPFADLGLIVVDEEHDASFKQEDGVIYQARDMAVVRASLHAVPIVLASATPSLETLNNVERGRYRRLVLPDRHGGASLPRIDLIDLRVSRPARQGFLSPALLQAIEVTLGGGEQTMLFLNRRGYAPLTLCRTCGHRINARIAPPGWSSIGCSAA